MIAQDIINLILRDAPRISGAIETGAAWEIWMQVELLLLLRQAGVHTARELPYPNNKQKLDFLATDGQGSYAIELKVESATKAKGFMGLLEEDIKKIAGYPQQKPGYRWVVGICYSVKARDDAKKYGTHPAVVYGESQSIGVIIVSV
jgi:hypothetical protein